MLMCISIAYFTLTVWWQPNVLCFEIKCTQIPQTHMTNLPCLRFSWLLPPNTLAKMMMSDRNFYIPSQLTSQPCPPPALSVEAELTHACQTATSPFTLFNSAHN
ncbi:hypothetical protein XENOCAPTIV_012279 [Xenoophorus captivus]|uniref:Secreted protein n=1 Tax=Xenoophorus captivus TaxID=1517983 RepID=A0ABV0SEW9_9TELE